jgi:chromate transporter
LSDAALPITHAVVRPSCSQLFWGFTRIGVSAFGGVLPYAHHQLVTVRRWQTESEFTAMLAIGQLLPGPNIVNVAIMLGREMHGFRGAVSALFGILLIPFFLMVAIVAVYMHFNDITWVEKAFRGIGAAAAGLILGVGVKLGRAQPKRAWAFAAMAAAVVAIGVLRVPLIPVMIVLAGASLVAAKRWGR